VVMFTRISWSRHFASGAGLGARQQDSSFPFISYLSRAMISRRRNYVRIELIEVKLDVVRKLRGCREFKVDLSPVVWNITIAP
jgi:hypothetical protein